MTQQMTRANSSAPVARREGATFADLVKQNKSALQQIAADSVDLSRLYRIITGAMQKTPALQKCSLASILRAMMDAAEVGLEPNTPLQLAYLVPYGQDCTYLIGYRGLVELARRSGKVYDVEVHAVFEGDKFEYEQGLTPVLRHVPGFGDRSPAKLTHVYAIARFVNGSAKADVMTRADVDAIRARSKAGNGGPWVTDYAEMAKKSVVRRICKLLPRSIEMERALMQENRAEARMEVLPPLQIASAGDDYETPFDSDITEEDGDSATSQASHQTLAAMAE